jgi:cell division protein FtsI/penicillin-binding protein 2
MSMIGPRRGRDDTELRYRALFVFFALCLIGIVLRLGYLQIMQYGLYSLYASDQHDLEKKLLPTRGQVLVRDRSDGSLHPLATNRLSWQVYAVPRDIKDPVAVAHGLAESLGLVEADIVARLTKRADDPYELIAKDVDAERMEKLKALNLEGVGTVQSTARLYPEKGIGGQMLGFLVEDPEGGMKGQYGIEGSYQDVLKGTPGSLFSEKDASGRRLVFAQTELDEAINGSDIILTIDRNVQFKACQLVQQAVTKHQADGGSIIVMEPSTGAILASCSAPDFDSSDFRNVKDISILNNPVTLNAYEPGSVFKAFTMAAGIDAEKITPKTTYVDTGAEKIDDFTIHNSDRKSHGLQTMTQALDESLNTATIFVERLLGKEAFRSYIEAFGFGKKTDVGLTPEAKADISNLSKKGSIFAATGSFGQGLTVTPIQLLAAYGALANGGNLMRPYIVDEIVHPDGRRERTKSLSVNQPISKRASRLITGMLVSAVENGHGKRAGVPGYWVAGKTGTAQVPKKNGGGYETDATIGSFAGYAPAEDPKFVMLVKIDHPRDVQWAESSAAPVFGEMAKYLLTYLQVPPERPVREVKVAPLPVVPSPPMSPSSTTP